MQMHTPLVRQLARCVAALALLGAAALPASAQDFGAMIQLALAQQNTAVVAAQQMVQQAVQQRMRDPAVQAGWQRYVAAHAGRPPIDYPTYTYHWIYTRGFSRDGVAHMRANEAGIQQREAQAVQGWRQAQAEHADAQGQLMAQQSANRQEAGLALRGQSTWTTPDGRALTLPHTWQRGSTYRHQGMTVRVDHGGHYHVMLAGGGWMPLRAGR